MKKSIGIPRALLYYRYHVLWKTFFKMLGCNIVLSPKTNKQIVATGKNLSIDEACLSSKIFLGHVEYLSDKCDYLLIPRICNYGKNEKVCVKFYGLYDQIKNQYSNLKILNYNIEKTKLSLQIFEYIKMGLKLDKNILKVLHAYIKAKNHQKQYDLELINNQQNKIVNDKTKILIISHPYNIYDNFIGSPIINFLKNFDIEIIYGDRLDKKIAIEYSKTLSNTLYWKYNKELIGAIEYYKNSINGIIFITSFPCGPDSLVNELCIRKISDMPILNLIIDESMVETGLYTRLESFVDIIKGKIEND